MFGRTDGCFAIINYFAERKVRTLILPFLGSLNSSSPKKAASDNLIRDCLKRCEQRRFNPKGLNHPVLRQGETGLYLKACLKRLNPCWEQEQTKNWETTQFLEKVVRRDR